MFSEIPFPGLFTLLGRSGISTFSLLHVVAILTSLYLAHKEAKKHNLSHEIIDNSLLFIVMGSIVGAKLFFVLESWGDIWTTQFGFWYGLKKILFSWNGIPNKQGMWPMIFSGGGLVFYGGLILATVFAFIYLRYKKVSVLAYLDAYAIAIAVGYAIGRTGCFVSGDGCYGHSSHGVSIPLLTWVFGPADGVCPGDPALAWKYPYMCSAGVRVWNTPMIEAFASLAMYFVLANFISKRNFRQGMASALFLAYNGAIRFLVEFLRLNKAVIPILESPKGTDLLGNSYELSLYANTSSLHPEKAFFRDWYWNGITQAQIIGLILFLIGVLWIFSAKLYVQKDTKSK